MKKIQIMRTTYHFALLMVTEISKDVSMGGFNPNDLLGENVALVPILAPFIRLLVS